MTISIELPHDLELRLRRTLGEPPERIARDALIAAAYRTGVLSLGEVAELVEVPTQLDAQRWLAARGTSLNYGLDDLESDRKALAKRLHPKPSH